MKKNIEWFKYVATLLITVGLFFTVFYVTKVVNERRFSEIKSIQDKISIDLLSSETQFALLNSTDCSINASSILAPEIEKLGDRLSIMEAQLGTSNDDVISLKKYYSLLQIKDYMLTKALAARCKVKPVTVLYFYTNDCSECTKQGYVLTALREKYPQIRIYAFDSNLDLSAIKTLETINVISGERPSIAIDGITYAGFKSLEDIEKALGKELKRLQESMNTHSTSSTTSSR
jgi:hypothetical protein